MENGRGLTIGFLCDVFNAEDPLDIWRGVDDAARAHGVNLFAFPGGALRSADDDRAYNTLFDLVSRERLDGVVVWGAQLAVSGGMAGVNALYDSFHPLPIVNLGMPMEGIPSLWFDNYQGMHDIVTHLIEVHGHRRIAYLSGPEGTPESQERYHGYADALAEHAIPLDPALVATDAEIGQVRARLYGTIEGVQAFRMAGMQVLLDDRRLRPGEDFQAVVGYDDSLALGALFALRQLGVRTPYDVAVVGFDDMQEAAFAIPPLTTVRQSFYTLGSKGAELLLALLAGRDAPERTSLPMQVVVRRSCGCSSPAVLQAGSVIPPRAGQPTGGDVYASLNQALTTWRKTILAQMTEGLHGAAENEAERRIQSLAWAEQLLESCVQEIKGEKQGVFLGVLDLALRQSAAAGYDVEAWQGSISALRRYLLPYLPEAAAMRAEGLWHQARAAIGEMARRLQARRTLQERSTFYTLRSIGQKLLTSFREEELTHTLADGLLRLGVASAYLALYDEPESRAPGAAPEWARLILACEKGERVELESGGRRFPSRQLVPPNLLSGEETRSFVVQSLHSTQGKVGFFLMETNHAADQCYTPLRDHISIALKNILLLQKRERAQESLRRAYVEVERQVAERTAELEQKVAERERAQAENLRMQAEMIEAQQQAIRELSTPIIPVLKSRYGGSVIVVPLIGVIDGARARDITRRLLAGIQEHRAKIVIMDVTGVPIVDSIVADHLNKAIHAARLKGAMTIVTGLAGEVAETIVELGVEWAAVEMVSDLQTGLQVAAGLMRRIWTTGR